jgi:AcrR family transcriptional regulator
MGTEVKRRYHAPRRQEQAAATRAAVLDAARELFVARGYAGTSIRDVAAAGRVGEQTVYRLFATKAVLLREVLLAAVSGTSDGATTTDRPDVIEQVVAAPTASDRLRIIGQWSAAGYRRGSADLEMVVFSAAETDPRVRELAARIRELRYADVRALVAAVAGETEPPSGMTFDDIADYIYAIWSSPVHQMLVQERGWTTDRFVDWTVQVVERLFLEPSVASGAGHAPASDEDGPQGRTR